MYGIVTVSLVYPHLITKVSSDRSQVSLSIITPFILLMDFITAWKYFVYKYPTFPLSLVGPGDFSSLFECKNWLIVLLPSSWSAHYNVLSWIVIDVGTCILVGFLTNLFQKICDPLWIQPFLQRARILQAISFYQELPTTKNQKSKILDVSSIVTILFRYLGNIKLYLSGSRNCLLSLGTSSLQWLCWKPINPLDHQYPYHLFSWRDF